MILATGEALFDHFTDYRRVGGAPLNFSYHLKKLGVPVRFITRVGDDEEGRELKDLLSVNGFDEEDLQIDPDYPTGAVEVDVEVDGVPVFNILTDVAFDNLQMDGTVRSAIKEGPELVYFGTLIQRTAAGSRYVEELFSSANGTARFLCDLNLRPGCYSREALERSLARADVLKLNEEELEIICRLLGFDHQGEKSIRKIMDRFHIEIIALTRGGKGSAIYDRNSSCETGPVRGLKVADTVGAGDAYASILAIGYLKAWNKERILETASRFSAAICQIQGALPDTDRFYDEFLGSVGENGDEE